MGIGSRIKARRKALGFSAEELAATVGCTPQTMYRYEKEEISKIPGKVLFALALKLDTTVDYLMGTTDNPTRTSLLTESEVRISQKSTIERLFQLLIFSAGFSEQMDEDANVALSKGDLVLNETPELIERVMDQTVDYFTYLLEREARR